MATLTDNLLPRNHIDKEMSSLLIIVIKVFKSFAESSVEVSSANRIYDRIDDVLCISFMYKRNKIGPKIDPWAHQVWQVKC